MNKYLSILAFMQHAISIMFLCYNSINRGGGYLSPHVFLVIAFLYLFMIISPVALDT